MRKPEPKPTELWAYPRLLDLRATPELRGLLCYIMAHYGDNGINVLIERRPVDGDIQIRIQIGDWAGQAIDLSKESDYADLGMLFMDRYAQKFVELMKLVGITVAQYYLVPVMADNGDGPFLHDLRLCDLRLGPIAFAGPGMVRDIFGKMIPTPEIIKIDAMTDDMLDMLDRGFGSYAGNIVVKPSRYRTVERDATTPLFAEIRR